MIPVIVQPAAEADIADAFNWYEQQRPGLGDELRAELKFAFDSIAENPLLFAALHRNTHRILLRRFPYSIYYRAYPDIIVVIACMHARRNPRRWQARG